MKRYKTLAATVIVCVLLLSNAYAADQIHVKIEIYYKQSLLANPTLIAEENKLNSMSMTMPGFQNYDLSFLIKTKNNEMLVDLNFKSGEHKLIEKFMIELDKQNAIQIKDYKLIITPKYIE